MRLLIAIIVFVFASFSTMAEERSPEFWNELKSGRQFWWESDQLDMSATDHKNFDAAMVKLYTPDCDCIRFIMDGRAYEIFSPLTLKERSLVIDGFRRGQLIPLLPTGEGS